MFTRFKATREQKKLLKAIKKNPDDSSALAQLGWNAYAEHDEDEASRYFTRAIEARSEAFAATDALYGLALIDLEHKRYAEAREMLRQIIKDSPDFQRRAEVHLALGQANEWLWRTSSWKNEKEKAESDLLQRARDHYQQALERKTEQRDSANFFLGKLLYDSQQQEEAISYLQQVSNSTMLDQVEACEANALLGRYFWTVKQDAAKGREFLEMALKKNPKQNLLADIQRQLGDIAYAQTDDDLATQCYEQALTAYKDVQTEEVLETLVNLSELKYRHHWLKAAIDYAERGLQIPTESKTIPPRLLKILAQSYAGIKDYVNAAAYEQQYFQSTKDPDEKAASLLRLGVNYELQEQVKDAVDAYRKGLKFAKRNLEASKLNAALGRLYLHDGRFNQAINHIKEAVEKAEEDKAHAAAVYRLLGECHTARKETEKAIEAYGKILVDFPETGEEPVAREALKDFRKQFKKELQEIERAQKQEDADLQVKAGDAEEVERLLELIDEILDEKGFFERLKEGLAKTHLSFVARIEELLAKSTDVDDELIENLEEALILSDIGVATSQCIIEHLQESVERKELQDPRQIKFYLKREVQAILQGSEKRLDIEREKPFVILVIGVNGTGKTTTIGKMASKFKAMGKNVLLVAGDTFRAAAIEQLEIWGERAGCEVLKHTSGADPSAVMFDAIQAAKSRNVDVVIADTAGRLHTKKNLMEELKKMVRVIARELPGAPHETLMVVDATTGQNAISQAQLFHEGVGLSGLILTKLDGTAKGGIIVGIANDLNLPVTYIGIGEKVEDLREFHAKEFVDALFED
ncbi:signal recognition particle-docking protein FtsY [Candidatus Vecturithrix granuli]|uniref:Signal recognition particle receptor FtsY n=1 Tax=Vecturithrix granuli TaxID=1499967 RepID=A0A081BYI2_VECG1|nr:signal recognition particle-docking protein FtsY [Candidatus Vecturithrix granuli]